MPYPWETAPPQPWGTTLQPTASLNPHPAVPDVRAPYRQVVLERLSRLDADQSAAVAVIRDPVGPNVRGAAVAGSGKCVTGDTLICTPNGLLPIRDAADASAVVAVDAETLTTPHAPCHWFAMGVSPVLEVETARGVRLRMTPEHPLLVWRGALKWVEARHLREDDVLLLIPGYACGTGTRTRDPEEAYLAGLFMGDGHCSGNHASWSRGGDDLPKEFLARLEQFWRRDFPNQVRRYEHGTSVDWHMSSVSLVARLRRDELAFSSAHNKCVPSWVLQGDDLVRRRFLQGLWDTDGTATGDRAVEWLSASERLAREVFQLLLGLGVVGTLRPKHVKGYDHVYWRLLLSGDQARKFERYVGFRYERKKCADLARMVAKPSNPNIGCYPHVRPVLRLLREEWKARGWWEGRTQTLVRDDVRIHVHCYLNGTRTPSADKLYELTEGCASPAAQTLRALARAFPDPVVRITACAAEPVYDLNVPSTHAFVANGVVSHNTTLLITALAALLVLDGFEPEDILATTFTSKAGKELTSRLAPLIPASFMARLRLGTFHSLALKAMANLDPAGPWSPSRCVDIGEDVPKAKYIWESIVGWRKDGVVGSGAPSLDLGGSQDAARDYALVVDNLRAQGLAPNTPAGKRAATEREEALHLPRIHDAWAAFEEAKQALGAFDFADVLSAFLSALQAREYRALPKIVAVDEFQDNSWVQGEIVRELGRAGRIVLLGDRKQCIPEGQHVRTPYGPRPIESIVPGDFVLSAAGGIASRRRVIDCFETGVHPRTLTFTTTSGAQFSVTPNHCVFACLGEPEGWYVYLMYREGYGFRIGSTQVTGRKALDHLLVRTKQEHAGRLWILGVFPSGAEARRVEHHLAYWHGVPMDPFVPRPGSSLDAIDEPTQLAWWAPFASRGFAVLEAAELDFERPAYMAKSSSRGVVSVNVVQSTRKGYSEVAVESQLIPEAIADKWVFSPTRRGCLRLRRYPASVAQAEALAGHLAGDLRDAGVAVQVVRVLAGGERRIFETRAAGLFPGMLVPVRQPDDTIALERVVSRETNETPTRCYDLEIEQSANFLVNDVVVHNSIYPWRGGDPTLFDDAEQRYAPCATVGLRYNYRSRRLIIEAGNRVAAALGPKARVGGDALVGKQSAHPGEIRTIMGADAFEEASAVAEFLKAQHAAGRRWSDMAILVRTNSRAGTYEGALMSARVPVARVGGTPFFERQDVLCFLAYAVLGEHDSWEALRRVVNRPKRFIPNTFLQAVGESMNAGHSLLVAIDACSGRLGAGGRRGAQDLSRFIRRLRTLPWAGQLGAITQLLEAEIGKAEGVEPADDKRAVPQTCREIAMRFNSAADLAAYADAAVQNAAQVRDPAGRNAPDRVVLSTVHRCVAPETWVETNSGVQQIGALPPVGRIVTPAGLAPYGNKVTYATRAMLRITTARGYQVCVTHDHGLTAWDAAHGYVRKTADKLQVGDFLRLRIGACAEDVRGSGALPPPVTTADVRACKVGTPGQMCASFAELLGMLVADGTVYPRGVRVVKADVNYVQRFREHVERLFHLPTSDPYQSGDLAWRSEVNSTALVAWLAQITDCDGLPALFPHRKRVPRVVLEGSLAEQAAFLRGVHGDASVNLKNGRPDHVAFSTKEREVGELVQLLLLRQGIASRRFASGEYWRVDTPAGFLQDFQERIGFVQSSAEAALALHQPTPSDYPVPVRTVELPAALRRDFGALGRSAYQNGRLRGRLSRHTVARLAEVTTSSAWSDALTFLHEPIASIEAYNGPAVCVEVPTEGRFLQNRFDGFNSKGLEYPVVVVSIPDGVFPHSKSPREEELCLGYVAVTRAEETLVLAWPTGEMDGRRVEGKKALGASELLDIVLPGARERLLQEATEKDRRR